MGCRLVTWTITTFINPGLQQAPFTELWYADTTARDSGTLRRYFAPRSNLYYQTSRTAFSGSLGYITGSHQIRIGGVGSFGPYKTSVNENGDGYMVFTNGMPINFVAINTPYYQWPRLDADVGLFITDTWHFKRFAITAGVRWEYLAGEILTENAPGGRFVPARTVPNTTCDTVKGMGCWKDWTPRLGVVYDVFGNHKLAVKAGFGKYNSAYSTGFTNNFNPMSGVSEPVTWNLPAGATNPGGPCAPIQFNGVPAPNPNCFPDRRLQWGRRSSRRGCGYARSQRESGVWQRCGRHWRQFGSELAPRLQLSVQRRNPRGTVERRYAECQLVPAFSIPADLGPELRGKF